VALVKNSCIEKSFYGKREHSIIFCFMGKQLNCPPSSTNG
jgi:hypothetical protein